MNEWSSLLVTFPTQLRAPQGVHILHQILSFSNLSAGGPIHSCIFILRPHNILKVVYMYSTRERKQHWMRAVASRVDSAGLSRRTAEDSFKPDCGYPLLPQHSRIQAMGVPAVATTLPTCPASSACLSQYVLLCIVEEQRSINMPSQIDVRSSIVTSL